MGMLREYENLNAAGDGGAGESRQFTPGAPGLPGPRASLPPVGMGPQGKASATQQQSARGALESLARKRHREADGLDILLRSIPQNLPPQADEALWNLVMKGF